MSAHGFNTLDPSQNLRRKSLLLKADDLAGQLDGPNPPMKEFRKIHMNENGR